MWGDASKAPSCTRSKNKAREEAGAVGGSGAPATMRREKGPSPALDGLSWGDRCLRGRLPQGPEPEGGACSVHRGLCPFLSEGPCHAGSHGPPGPLPAGPHAPGAPPPRAWTQQVLPPCLRDKGGNQTVGCGRRAGPTAPVDASGEGAGSPASD